MKPSRNDLVKIFLKNGLQVEGKIQSWDKEIILTSDDSQDYLVITKPKQVIMYKVIKQPIIENKPYYNPEIIDREEVVDEEVFQPSSELQEEVTDQDLKFKSMIELRKLKIEEEKKAIAKRMKEHHTGPARKVEYTSHDQIPGFYKK